MYFVVLLELKQYVMMAGNGIQSVQRGLCLFDNHCKNFRERFVSQI